MIVFGYCKHNNNLFVNTVTVNKNGDTPLTLACRNGRLDTVKYLVKECHCDPNGKTI